MLFKTTINTAFGLNINQYDNGNCTMWPLLGNAADSELDFLTVDAAQNKYRIKMLGVHNKYLRPNGSGDLANVYWSATNDDWCLWQLEEEGSYSSIAKMVQRFF
ncbi:MAG: hypothetical protein RR846_07605 [Oscillospiraceae bacterium]